MHEVFVIVILGCHETLDKQVVHLTVAAFERVASYWKQNSGEALQGEGKVEAVRHGIRDDRYVYERLRLILGGIENR